MRLHELLEDIRTALLLSGSDDEIFKYFNAARPYFGDRICEFLDILAHMSDILGPWFDFIFSSLTNNNILCFGDFIGDRARDVAQDFDYYLKNYPMVSNYLLPSTFQRPITQTSGYFTHELDAYTGLVMNRLNRNLGDLPKVTEDLQRAMLSWCTWTLRSMWDPSSKWFNWRSRDGMVTIDEVRNGLTNRYYLGILKNEFRIREFDPNLFDSLANETWLVEFIHDNNLQPIQMISQEARVLSRDYGNTMTKNRTEVQPTKTIAYLRMHSQDEPILREVPINDSRIGIFFTPQIVDTEDQTKVASTQTAINPRSLDIDKAFEFFTDGKVATETCAASTQTSSNLRKLSINKAFEFSTDEKMSTKDPANAAESQTEVNQETLPTTEDKSLNSDDAPTEINKPGHWFPEFRPFYKESPRIWFIQAEVSLRLAGIRTERTKADVVFTSLDPSIARVAKEIVESPDENAPYTRMKEHMIRYFDEERLRSRLFGKIDPRNSKPSQIFAKICYHAGTGYTESVLRLVFMEYLPERLRQLLVDYKKQNIMDLVNHGDVVARIMGLPSDDKALTLPQDTTADVLKEIRELKHFLMDGTHWSRSRSHDRSVGLCRFHKKYADKAYNCVEPCSWNIM